MPTTQSRSSYKSGKVPSSKGAFECVQLDSFYFRKHIINIMSIHNAVFLTTLCESCRAFCEHYAKTDQICNIKKIVIGTDDWFSHPLIDLLDALSITELPCIVWDGHIYTGINAFAIMSELTGVPCTNSTNKSSSNINDLRCRANLDRSLQRS